MRGGKEATEAKPDGRQTVSALRWHGELKMRGAADLAAREHAV